MALVLAGGFLGFWAAVIGYAAFEISALAALAIWALSGPAAALLALLVAPVRPAARRPAAPSLAEA